MQARETYYKEIWFKSRSEAMFAAYLDKLNMLWQYEPYLAPGWFPDFVVNGRVLVDLRPAQSVEDFMQPDTYLRVFTVPLHVDWVWLAPVDPLVSSVGDMAMLGWRMNAKGDLFEVPFLMHDRHCSYIEAQTVWKDIWREVVLEVEENYVLLN